MWNIIQKVSVKTTLYFCLMFNNSILALSNEPRMSHSSPTAMVESWSCQSNQTQNGRPLTSDNLHVAEPVPGMRLVLFAVV